MLQALAHLSGTRGVRAIHEDLFGPHLGAAGRARRRALEAPRGRRPRRDVDADHLRDDLARLLDPDSVADPHVLALELDEVVQRRSRYGGAGDEYGLELGHGRELAALADL